MIPRDGAWPQGCFWLCQLQLSPGNGADGLQHSNMLLLFPFLLVSGVSNLELGCRMELVSLALSHPAISEAIWQELQPPRHQLLTPSQGFAVGIFNKPAPPTPLPRHLT